MRAHFTKYLMTVLLLIIYNLCFSQTTIPKPAFHVLVLTERGGIHEGFVVAALDWLGNFFKENNIEFTVINNTDSISDAYLSRYQEFIQLNYPPYMWTDLSKAAFIKYMEGGLGGWVGFHHASLLGEFDGYSMWNWYSQFMGAPIAARASAPHMAAAVSW